MIVPGEPSDPIQLIDVRDVADWIVHCLERSIYGIYNATGPAQPLSMKGMVENVRAGTSARVEFIWMPTDFLDARKVPEGQFPLYDPPTGDSAGLHRCNCSRALQRGLTFRPLSETARDCLAWYQSLPAKLQASVAPQFAERPGQASWLETEKRLLESWNQRANK